MKFSAGGPAWKTVLLGVSLLSTFLGISLSFPQTVDQTSVEVAIRCEDHQLAGQFYANASAEVAPTVILVRGFPGGKGDDLELGQILSQRGVNMLTFNYSGTYRSEGVYTLEITFKDIQAACNFIHQSDVVEKFRIDTSRIILGGYSHGGGMVLIYAASHPEIRRVFSIAGNDFGEFAREYTRNADMARNLDTAFDRMKAPNGPVRFSGRQILKDFAARPEPFDLRLWAPRLADRDILLVGGWDDPYVTVENFVVPFYRALKSANATNVRIIAFPTNHSFRNVRDDLASEVIRWVQADPFRSQGQQIPRH
jgi:dipeptidyl aminopeptidase/acylaminoacyl peptidase